MKLRFSTYDLICIVTELQKCVGMRVNQIYDVDHKTYLIRFHRGEEKCVLLMESGIRIHTTLFEWPKNVAPSGFSMKLRKHIKNKRLEKLNLVGLDRIVDMQFGTGEAAYHIILELYDRGNIVFTDFNYLILNVLRPHTEGEEVRFAVREKYPADRGKGRPAPPSESDIEDWLKGANATDAVKRVLNPKTVYGPAIIEHVLLKSGFPNSVKVRDLKLETDLARLVASTTLAEQLIDEAFAGISNGYIIQKEEKRATGNEILLSYQEFHPIIFEQHKNQPYAEFPSFDRAADEFYSSIESQKIDLRAMQQEKSALKKLDNVKADHERRLVALSETQIEDKRLADLILRNTDLVEDAIYAINRALSRKMNWQAIQGLVDSTTENGDPVASCIKRLKLKTNEISLYLTDTYDTEDDIEKLEPALVDINLSMSAYANATKYYCEKRQAAVKQQKTLDAQDKAFKNAERKTRQTLKEVKTSVTISKARKVYWFEKFYWFISTENYLVIGGRDQQQNELIVKRYMRTNDIYLHAGIQGGSSVIVKNPTSDPIPPVTLTEAGIAAMCYSHAWDSKVVTSAWWVHANQVSKTAPTGEYLSVGSFMIRGKKNFLLQSHLIMGFGFMFKLEDSSADRHKNDRKVRALDENASEENSQTDIVNEVDECVLNDGSSSSGSEESDDNEDPEKNSKVEYPDTKITVDHSKYKVNIEVPEKDKLSLLLNKTSEEKSNVNEEEVVVFLGDDKPVILKPRPKKDTKVSTLTKEIKSSLVVEDKEDDAASKRDDKQLKRGQKAKMKKIKNKYKDRDEEDLQLWLETIRPTSVKNEEKKNKKSDKKSGKNCKRSQVAPRQIEKPVIQLLEGDVIPGDASKIEENDEEDAPEMAIAHSEMDMLDLLTGQPLPEDELLFAMPVVAPYRVLTNYKYKVKLTPGTGKRGKACKSALNMFLKDRFATGREKDLMKFVKDQDLARNFPGKVKVSAPQLHKNK